MMENKRIKSLENIRFIMAVIILLVHVSWVKFLHNPYISFKFFFIMSGFGLALKNETFDSYNVRTCILYAVGRIKKIYKWYIAIILITLPIQFANLSEWHDTGYAILGTILTIIVTPTLMQSIFGIKQASHLGVDSFWFLSCIFVIHIFFPIIKNIHDKTINRINNNPRWGEYRKLFFYLIVLATLIFVNECEYRLFRIFQGQFPLFNDLGYGTPYINIFPFVEGIVLADIHVLVKDKIRNSTILEFLSVIIFLSWWILSWCIMGSGFDLTSNTIVALLIVICFSFEKGIISRSLNKIDLGRYSGYLYLIHFTVLWIVLYFTDNWIVNSVLVLLISLTLSVIMYKWDKRLKFKNKE